MLETDCYAQSPSSQNWENKTSTAMQKHKGVLLPAWARAPISSSAVESWREPWVQIYSSIYKFSTKTGSWQGLIGCRGFLVFTDWPVIIPLIGQSYHLSGFQSYHLSDWPELPSLEAPAAWLRDYFWPSAPLWACHGSREVVTPSGGKSIGVSVSVLPMNIQDWFPLW